MRVFVITLWAIFGAVAITNGWAQSQTPTRYMCRAAKNLAVVGAWDRDGVLVVERNQDQECRFSINGAPAGTPPLGQVLEGWEFIRRTGWTSSATFPVSPLAFALSAASPYESIAPGLSDVITKSGGALLNCFGARDAGAAFEISSGDVVCRMVRGPARGILRVEGSAGVEFAGSSPQLQLGIRATNTVHYLFLPSPR